ncbi:serine hydrolase [Cytophagaceae bacterium DM2B3-1]|uniref:Serine hydrolase n=1 Tax=Xanthocytophaga flava TaxID=3048013 RepID=A0ABT7CT94_9BACT|nr:serine hydrolase [Xanthocytophaga flavus]MDJ1472209.1 serine hydrolase [Xanthocytophaga flavus]MDJ1496993.1 serine hydrolase [Xanthocytophaga flavus]
MFQRFWVGLCMLTLTGCTPFLNDPAMVYSYYPPDQKTSEWSVSSLNAENIAIKPIEELTNLIQTEKYRNIHSLLIVRNGKLVYEQYFNGYTSAVPENIYSATKSITSILTGIAIDQHMIADVNSEVLLYFPEYLNGLNNKEQKKKITLKHLLTMSSGLACNDAAGRASPGFEENMYKSSDWIYFTLDLPVLYEVGTIPQYCTAGVVTLGGVINRASTMSTESFAWKYLFSPLNIQSYRWDRMPDGEISVGGRLFIRPIDMAKIGQLMLDKGKWKGQQLVSSQWVTESTTKQAILQNFEYGYLWWRRTFVIQEHTYQMYFAWGNGGNYLCVLPDYNTVLICTGGNPNSVLSNQFFQMLQSKLLPAIQ